VANIRVFFPSPKQEKVIILVAKVIKTIFLLCWVFKHESKSHIK